MDALQTQKIKFGKGDSLDAIAKKHQVTADKVWKFPDNKKIAATRGKPDKLQPGDVLVIPPPDKAVQAARKNLEACIKVVDGEAARITLRLKYLDKAEADIKASVAEAKKDLNAEIAKLKKISTAVDLAATLVNIGKGLGGSIAKGMSGVKKTGAELEKHTEEVQKEAIKMAYSPFIDMGVKVISAGADSANDAVRAMQAAVKAYDKMTSPSFWSNTAAQLLAGKSWSEAVTKDVTSDLTDKIKEMEDTETIQLGKFKIIRGKISGQQGNVTAAQKQLKTLLKDLP